MEFKSDYSRKLDGSDDVYKWNSKFCILPFFGFEYYQIANPYTQTIYTKNDSDYTSHETKKVRTAYDYYEGFKRQIRPEDKLKSLEDRFNSVYGYNYDPLKKKYLPLSVEEYYNMIHSKDTPGCGCSFSIFLIIIWFVFYLVTGEYIENAAVRIGLNESIVNFVCILLIPILMIIIFAFLGGIIELNLMPKHGGKTNYSELTVFEKRKIREEYLDYIKKTYQGNAGKILVEYAKLKGYDKI